MASGDRNGKAGKGAITAGVAVLYLRQSTDKQETSIEDQRSELVRYASTHKYQVAGEYVDKGISGDRTEKRSGFLQMREDAAARKFGLVLCWNQDRFGRFDLIDGGHYIRPFRLARVRLETIAQGPVDWEDLTGQLVYSVNQVGKAQFLRDLSHNVCRGLLSAAREGRGTGGNRIPFGYRVQRDFDDRGKLADYRLVVDPDQADVVRLIFRLYQESGGSYRAVAHELNRGNKLDDSNNRPRPAKIRVIWICHAANRQQAETFCSRFACRSGGVLRRHGDGRAAALDACWDAEDRTQREEEAGGLPVPIPRRSDSRLVDHGGTMAQAN